LSRVIIGIHGLGNKPPKWLFKQWWKQSIREGLKAIGKPYFFFNFEMVYWAHILHPFPLSPWERKTDHPLYLNEPYVPGTQQKAEKPGSLKTKVRDYLVGQLSKILLNDDLSLSFTTVTDIIIHRYFSDLDSYYDAANPQSQSTRDRIQQELVQILKKHRSKEILLISHSMGSIVAYDVLTQAVPNIKIDTLITIGSPLGLPIVISKIVSEQHQERKTETAVRTPENITRHWYNFSDMHDKIAFAYRLNSNFKENSHHIKVEDSIVKNDYKVNGNSNPHKDFGYLRTPELAKVIYEFLTRDQGRFWIWLNNKISFLLSLNIRSRRGS
jgi:hypothetical protein